MATPAERTGHGYDRRAIAVWLGLLLLVAFAVLAWRSGGSRAQQAGPSGPWIGLPPGGMDASGWDARASLGRLYARGAPATDLLRDCGQDAHLPRERYLATLADAGQGQAARLMFDVGNEDIVATALPSAPVGSGSPPARTAAIVRALRRDQLAEVRGAWLSSSLWGEAAATSVETAGPVMQLEACVDGRYALRRGSSDEAAALRLRRAFVQALELRETAPDADAAAIDR